MKEKRLIQSVGTWPARKLLVVLLFLAFAAGVSAADVKGDTLEVRFRVGQSNIDLSYADNEQRINDFISRVQAHYSNMPARSLKLDVYGGASPEGPSELNRRLGEQRGVSLKEVLMQRLGNVVDQITVVNQGARWGGLYKMIEESNEPWKFEVLAILSETPTKDEWNVDPREQKLRKLKKGTVWNTLSSKYLTTLRSSGSAVITPLAEPRCCDTLVIRDTIIYLPEPCPQFEEPIDHSPVWALKTNLFLWGVIAPNVQVEFPLGNKNRWSIEGEVFWPWWIWNHNANAEQFGNVGLELKYWFGDREKHHTLDGWHLGLGVAAGYYDIEWKKHKGYQGEYLNVYANIGYQHRFGKNKQWLVDGGLALGWIPTKYRKYLGSSIFPEGHEEEYDDHLMWQKTSSKHIFGATHANFTLGYVFHYKNKKKENAEPVYVEPTANTSKELKKQTKADSKQAKAEAKQAAAVAKANAKQEKADAKAAAKAAKAESKASEVKDDASAKAAAKQAALEAKAAAKQEKAEAKAEAKAAKAEAKAKSVGDEVEAKIAAKEAKAAAKQAKADAKAAAKQEAANAKVAMQDAKAAAKAAEKEAKAEAKAAAKAAKLNS